MCSERQVRDYLPDFAAVHSKNEVTVVPTRSQTLAHFPLSGGYAPRQVVDNVLAAATHPSAA